MADEAESALEENLMRKGKHSYYYAHRGTLERKKSGLPAEERTYGGAPRLLARSVSSEEGKSAERWKSITEYAWVDVGKWVRLYIDIDGLSDDSSADDFEVEWSDSSVDLRARLPSGNWRLQLPKLHADITKAKVKVKAAKPDGSKPAQVLLSLRKADDSNWFSLKRKD
eukprot:PLAT9924.1.p2 GENE.PLAT9924.1~~PLAT9924.1.p2  ORF type:complete len:169 (+),score=89.63 PLAT9924.1:40-546(+)